MIPLISLLHRTLPVMLCVNLGFSFVNLSFAAEATFPLNPPRVGSVREGFLRDCAPKGNKIKISTTHPAALGGTFGLIVPRSTMTFTYELLPLGGWETRPESVDPFELDFKGTTGKIASKTLPGQLFFYDPTDAEDPGDYEHITPYVFVVDLDVDSDNSPHGTVDRNDVEDAMEAPTPGGTETGKRCIFGPSSDQDDDGIPNWADGFKTTAFNNQSGSGMNTPPFVPMTLFLEGIPGETKIKFIYSASNPAAVVRQQIGTSQSGQPIYKFTFPAGDTGHMRLWKRDGSASRDSKALSSGGDFIPTNVEMTVENFLNQTKDTNPAFGPGRRLLYVEAIRGSTQNADQQVKVMLNFPGPTPWVEADEVAFTLLPVKLEVHRADRNGNGTQPSNWEYQPSGTVEDLLSIWEKGAQGGRDWINIRLRDLQGMNLPITWHVDEMEQIPSSEPTESGQLRWQGPSNDPYQKSTNIRKVHALLNNVKIGSVLIDIPYFPVVTRATLMDLALQSPQAAIYLDIVENNANVANTFSKTQLALRIADRNAVKHGLWHMLNGAQGRDCALIGLLAGFMHEYEGKKNANSRSCGSTMDLHNNLEGAKIGITLGSSGAALDFGYLSQESIGTVHNGQFWIWETPSDEEHKGNTFDATLKGNNEHINTK